MNYLEVHFDIFNCMEWSFYLCCLLIIDFLFFFFKVAVVCGILVPQLGIRTPAMEVKIRARPWQAAESLYLITISGESTACQEPGKREELDPA